MEAGDTKIRFNMNPKDNKRETSASWFWNQQAMVRFRFWLRQASSGGLGCLASGRQRSNKTKKSGSLKQAALWKFKGKALPNGWLKQLFYAIT